jgi:hypothetical protein
VARRRHAFRAHLGEAEIDHQERLRGRQRRLAVKTLTALERLLDADDLIIVNLGVETVSGSPSRPSYATPEDRVRCQWSPALASASDSARPRAPGLPR